MARSIWKDALDGKIKALRDLQTRESYHAVYEYLRAGLATKGVRPTAGQLTTTALTYQRNLVATLRDAEPFYLSSDMVTHFTRQTESVDLAHVVQAQDLPVKNGLFWFPGTVEITDTDALDSAAQGRSLFVRGIMFALAKEGEYLSGVGLRQRADGHDVVGVTLLFDGAQCGLPNVASGLLLPFLYQPIDVGLPLARYIARATSVYGDVAHDLAHNVWGALFLWAAFEAMQRRIVRLGSLDVERDARRQAQRAGIAPSVRIVEWRKVAYTYPEGHTSTHVAWSCQWEVGSHERHLKSGKVVKVRAYVKGPRDKPFRERRERIHVIDR